MPQPSVEAAIEQVLADHRQSRRRFLGRAGGLALAASGMSSVLAACGGVEGTADKAKHAGSSSKAVSHPKVPLSELQFSNWPLYIDRKVLKAFERRYGVDVKYVEDVNDNTEFFGKVRQQLQSGQPTGRDLVALTDWMAARWVRSGFC